MKSKLTQLVVLLSVFLAFVPVLSVGYIFQSYVRGRETIRLQVLAGDVSHSAQIAIENGLVSLRTIINESPSLCTPTFVKNAQRQLQANAMLRQVLVENSDGVQYCDGYGDTVTYTNLSQELSLPGRTETLTLVRLAKVPTPVVKLSRRVGAKTVAVFIDVTPFMPFGAGGRLADSTTIRLSLTDGTPIATVGDYAAFEQRTDDNAYIAVSAFAGDIPLRTQMALVFADARADYFDLNLAMSAVAAALGGALLLIVMQVVRRSQLQSFDLDRALRLGELTPYYQPVIDLRTGRVLGCEMLVRWIKKNGEIVPPSAFIEYAEATGMAIPMTVHLMERVKADLGALYAEMPDMKVSINLFEGHFRDGAIVEDVQAIFGGAPIRYRQLVFEITERQPITQNVQAVSVIAGLHALGSRLAMDDVGTGHSNLAYIHQLGVDVLKIDRVFVDMIKPGITQLPVLDGLIAMARDLGVQIIAEGVETEEQALYLRAHGVTQAQGFLFAPAVKAESFISLARSLNMKANAAAQPAKKGAETPQSAEKNAGAAGISMDSEENAA